MTSGYSIFKKVPQKVKIFSATFTTEYFLAAHKRKQLFAPSFLVINLKTLAIKFQYAAEPHFVLTDTFRRLKEAVMGRVIPVGP
jgi:hypothetical protein